MNWNALAVIVAALITSIGGQCPSHAPFFREPVGGTSFFQERF